MEKISQQNKRKCSSCGKLFFCEELTSTHYHGRLCCDCLRHFSLKRSIKGRGTAN